MLDRITDEISLIKVKFHNIFTSVFLIKLDTGYALFDSGAAESDVNETIMPAISMAGIKPIEVRFLFISHTHGDHFGGATALLTCLPEARLVLFDTDAADSRGISDRLFCGSESEYSPIRAIELCGHARHCLAILDPRSRTLLSGDAVQLFGVSRWGTGVSDIEGYFDALEKIGAMDIDLLVTSHEYHPLGQTAVGKRAIRRYLNASKAALQELISYASAHLGEALEAIASGFTEIKRKREPNFPSQQAGTVSAILNKVFVTGS